MGNEELITTFRAGRVYVNAQPFADRAEAKAAAQADYESRILSALEGEGQ